MRSILQAILILSSLASTNAFADNNLLFKGDFRFRTEDIREEQVAPLKEAERTRQRMRLRFGGTAKVNDESDVIIRLASGSSVNTDNTTTNQDFTDYDSKKNILIDMAYFNYHPNENTQVWGGKTPNQYFAALSSDLIFDADLTPEGLDYKFKKSLDSNNEIFANAGANWISERYSATGATDNTDVGLIGLQLGYTKKLETCDFTVALASLNFSNIKGATAPSAKGNTLASGLYAHDYKLGALDLEINTTISELPVGFGAELVNNSDVSVENKGNNIGVRVGKLKDAGSWMVSVDYRQLEKDAALGMLTESDSSGGGTDIRTTKVVYGYQLGEKANFMLSYLFGKKTVSSTVFNPNYTRMMADFNFNF